MELFYEIEFNSLVRQVIAYNPKLDVDFLKSAYYFGHDAHSCQLRKSGEPYFQHCLEVAKTLANLRLDPVTIASGLLHDVIEDTEIRLTEIEEKFGTEVAILVGGVFGIRRLKTHSPDGKTDENFIENYIKMLLSVVKDIRVILIKLADRLHNMRTLKYLPEKKQQEIAIETKEIYVPLANRLGLSKIKSELEDLIFKFLNNKEYKKIASKVNEKLQLREQYTQSLVATIQEKLLSEKIKAKVEGRPKSFYSIYKKGQDRNLRFEEMYDLFAIRIIVEKLEDCYQALSIVHNNFEYRHDKFYDYIEMPKPNGYQSLHTVIFSKENKLVEIQIRTEDMHRIAEDGIAAHWKYKEGRLEDSQLDKYLVDFRQYLRQLAETLQEAKEEPKEVLEHLKIDFFRDEIFVYTPNDDVVKLPIGSTPIDFAFSIHSDLGLHCLSAKVNGRIVPFNYKLKSGDSVEIITGANQRPNRDWLKFVRTARARDEIKYWIKESMQEQSQKLGEEIIQEQLKHLKKKKEEINFEEIAQAFGLSSLSQLYRAVGQGDISVQRLIKKVTERKHELETKENDLKKFLNKTRGPIKGVRIQGLDNLLIHSAECCQPLPGDRILGFVTRTNGIVIHRSNCRNINKLMENSERNLDVNWDVKEDTSFFVRLHMLGHDRKNFLLDISDAIAKTHTNIVHVSINTQDSFIHGHIVIEVKNLFHLMQVINKIGKVNGVISVERLDGTEEPVANSVSAVSPLWNKAN